MISKVQKWGNSQGIRFTKTSLKQSEIFVGDFIVVIFHPQSGHEQKGRRPALVVSNDLFNKHTGFAMVCPITNTDRHFPFHIPISKSKKLTGFIMVEQIKSIDYQSRNAKFIEKVHQNTLNEVLSILDAIVY